MSTLVGQTALQKKLIWFWDCIDISENIKRAEATARRHPNGLGAWMNAAAMTVLTIIALVLAWKFDFESTIIGMSTLRDTVLEGLPASVLKFSVYIVFALTLAPTFIEMFTSAYAKADIKIIQILIIAFTGFDLVTDIPRAMTFTTQLQANFDQLGPIFGWIGYWVFFLFWLFLSTIGFELSMIIFGFLAIVYTIKALAGDDTYSSSARPFKGGSGKTTIDLGETGKAEKINVVG